MACTDVKYQAHTVIVCQCVVAIGITKKVAEDLAKEYGYRNYIVVPTTEKHLELFSNATNR